MSAPHDTDSCVKITPLCPVEETIYGYYPNLGVNAFFCAWFFVFTIINIFLTYRFKTWFFGSLLVLGCAGEAVGYIGRLMLHNNPWSEVGFETQICTLIFSPSFLAAALYLTLKHMARAIGPQFSPIKPILYPWIFIVCDVLSLLLQAVGGGVAASGDTEDVTDMGGNIMLAGIVFQVVTFTILYVLIGIFVIRVARNKHSLSSEAAEILYGRDFKIFAFGMLATSVFIFVRCVYRIAELAGGWANEVMRDEIGYIILDGVMCCLAAALMTVAHPGFWFKTMLKTPALLREKERQSSEIVVVEETANKAV